MENETGYCKNCEELSKQIEEVERILQLFFDCYDLPTNNPKEHINKFEQTILIARKYFAAKNQPSF